MSQIDNTTVESASRAIACADAIVVAAGAGMGVDSGLPDFRGNEGFWRAYPPFQKAGLSFQDVATPHWFDADPSRGWGFYGHRRNLYRATRPHLGFGIVRSWLDRVPQGGFVFTSNVDGHFQRAGFAEDTIVECHGTIDWNQCVRGCRGETWAANDDDVPVDLATFRAKGPFDACPHCGRGIRPNVLMFGDFAWIERRTGSQMDRFRDWLARRVSGRLVIVEFGAGTGVPTVRALSERLAATMDATLVRVNPRESQGPPGTLSISLGALEAIQRIAQGLAAIPKPGG